jgi:hypothetical protein
MVKLEASLCAAYMQSCHLSTLVVGRSLCTPRRLGAPLPERRGKNLLALTRWEKHRALLVIFPDRSTTAIPTSRQRVSPSLCGIARAGSVALIPLVVQHLAEHRHAGATVLVPRWTESSGGSSCRPYRAWSHWGVDLLEVGGSPTGTIAKPCQKLGCKLDAWVIAQRAAGKSIV